MKPATAATIEFKLRVETMAAYLASVGYDISPKHLTEATARFEGAANWRAHRAELQAQGGVEAAEVETLETDAAVVDEADTESEVPAAYVSDMEGQSVNVYLDVYGPGSTRPIGFCRQTVDQRWLNLLHSGKDSCWQDHLSEVVVEAKGPDWLGMPVARHIAKDSTSVGRGDFRISGVSIKDSEVAYTGRIKIQALEALVVQALLDDVKEVFLVGEAARHGILLARLDRSPGQAGYDA